MTEDERVKEKIAIYQMGLYCKAMGWDVDDWEDLCSEVQQKYLEEADKIIALKREDV